MIRCHDINPCHFNFEDVDIKTTKPWICGNLNITVKRTMNSPFPVGGCAVGPHPKADSSDDDALLQLESSVTSYPGENADAEFGWVYEFWARQMHTTAAAQSR